MKDFLLIYSSELAYDRLQRKYLQDELFALGFFAQNSLVLKSDENLLASLLLSYEASWQRMLAFCDEQSFASLNSALATTLALELELSNNEPTIACAQWLDSECIYFKHENREYFICKDSRNPLSAALKTALQNRAGAWLLDESAASAEILLSQLARANYLDYELCEIAGSLCAISLRANSYSDTDAFLAACEALFGARFISSGDIFAALLAKLVEKKLKISAAESCTAGLFSAKLAACEGASKALVGSLCVYSKAAKRSWLGVSALEGAQIYSTECAEQMAKAAAAKSSAHLGVGITGVLGASSDCGVERGTVSICAAFGERCIAQTIKLNAPRECMQEQAAIYAAALCYKIINND